MDEQVKKEKISVAAEIQELLKEGRYSKLKKLNYIN